MQQTAIPAHIPPALVFPFDFRHDEALRYDTWNYLNQLNDRPPVFFSPDLGGYWVVTRMKLIEEVFTDHTKFSTSSLAIPKLPTPLKLIPNSMDPPAHTPYRRLMANNLFSVRALGDLEANSRAHTIALFESFKGNQCEFVHDFAYRLPIDIFLQMMGADHNMALREECLVWIKKIFRGNTEEEIADGFAGASAFVTRWLRAQLKEPAANQGSMFRHMVEARIDGHELPFEDMHSITMMLFMGGLDTVTSQMTHIMCFLAENPGHRQQLIDDPELIPVAMEELLRRFGISFIGREAARDMDYHGAPIRKGDAVVAGTPIAGLDATVFPDPLRVDFARGKGGRVRHIGFGAGPHLCVGAYLARTQIKVMLEELLPRMRGMRMPAAAPIEMSLGATMMLKTLPLEWDGAAGLKDGNAMIGRETNHGGC